MTPEDRQWVAEFVAAAIERYDDMLHEAVTTALRASQDKARDNVPRPAGTSHPRGGSA